MFGIEMIGALEIFNDLGIVHNDLKMDNILIGDKDSSQGSLNQIKVIDFGGATPFVDSNGTHIKEKSG